MAKKKIKKLYKTVVTVEVLSEERLNFNNLQDLHEQITDGSNSGVFTAERAKVLKGREAVKETRSQGSDPAFFSMDEQGNETEY